MTSVAEGQIDVATADLLLSTTRAVRRRLDFDALADIYRDASAEYFAAMTADSTGPGQRPVLARQLPATRALP